ncbi:hypothetical protein BDZ97DRAFT_1640992, partial [Flammula alnicola]
VVQDLLEKYTRYAILSHTWLQLEVTYRNATDTQEWRSMTGGGEAGYKKLAGFCEVAAKEYDVSLAWMDTICINKDSSSEIDESIRSMFRWYQNSYVCITYLANTASLADMEADRWFTRGWTLQELLAPTRIKFYNKDWTPLSSANNDKPLGSSSALLGAQSSSETLKIQDMIQKVTGIKAYELANFRPGVGDGTVATRMVWAAKRTTTRGEDRAYSLLGIFGVSISIAYGEGAERAFFRLIEAILATFQAVKDVLNW